MMPKWLPCIRAARSRGARDQPGREIRGGAALLPDATNRKPAGRCGRAMTRAGLQPGSAGGIQGGVQEVAAAMGRKAPPRWRRWQGAGSRRRCAMCALQARAGAEAAKWEGRRRGGGRGRHTRKCARSPRSDGRACALSGIPEALSQRRVCVASASSAKGPDKTGFTARPAAAVPRVLVHC